MEESDIIGLERWLRGEENVLLFVEDPSLVPATTLGGTRGSKASGLWEYLNSHTHICTETYTHSKKNKNTNLQKEIS